VESSQWGMGKAIFLGEKRICLTDQVGDFSENSEVFTALGLEPFLPCLRFLLATLGLDGFLDPFLSI